MEREDYVDVFEFLEEFYKEIQEIKSNYEENCYFKYFCPEKKTEMYIIFESHPKEKINSLNFKFKDERYQYEKWKNDENLKKTLLEERKKSNMVKYAPGPPHPQAGADLDNNFQSISPHPRISTLLHNFSSIK